MYTNGLRQYTRHVLVDLMRVPPREALHLANGARQHRPAGRPVLGRFVCNDECYDYYGVAIILYVYYIYILYLYSLQEPECNVSYVCYVLSLFVCYSLFGAVYLRALHVYWFVRCYLCLSSPSPGTVVHVATAVRLYFVLRSFDSVSI